MGRCHRIKVSSQSIFGASFPISGCQDRTRISYKIAYTIKALINAQAFIRIITFHCEGGGHL